MRPSHGKSIQTAADFPSPLSPDNIRDGLRHARFGSEGKQDTGVWVSSEQTREAGGSRCWMDCCAEAAPLWRLSSAVLISTKQNEPWPPPLATDRCQEAGCRQCSQQTGRRCWAC